MTARPSIFLASVSASDRLVRLSASRCARSDSNCSILALLANKANIEQFESERAQREADNLTKRSEAETEAKKMEGLAVNMVRAASEMGPFQMPRGPY